MIVQPDAGPTTRLSQQSTAALWSPLLCHPLFVKRCRRTHRRRRCCLAQVTTTTITCNSITPSPPLPFSVRPTASPRPLPAIPDFSRVFRRAFLSAAAVYGRRIRLRRRRRRMRGMRMWRMILRWRWSTGSSGNSSTSTALRWSSPNPAGNVQIKNSVCAANEGPMRIKYECLVPILCFPRNETVQPPYFQNRIVMFCLPIPTFIYDKFIYF